MQEWEEKILEKRKARAEGRAEGRVKGRAEGETFRLIQLIKKKIQKSKSFIQIADELEEEPDNIQSLYECISQNINRYLSTSVLRHKLRHCSGSTDSGG